MIKCFTIWLLITKKFENVSIECPINLVEFKKDPVKEFLALEFKDQEDSQEWLKFIHEEFDKLQKEGISKDEIKKITEEIETLINDLKEESEKNG